MRSDVPQLVLSVGLAIAASVVLCGCVGPVSIAESSAMGGLPDAAVSTTAPVPDDSLEYPLLSGKPRIGWLDEGERFAVTFAGSSSCYAVPTAISAPTSRNIRLSLESTGGSACTADIALRTHVIRTPDGVDPTIGVEVTAVGANWVEVLPPLGAENPPPAIDLPVAVLIGPDGIATAPPEVIE